MQKLTVRLSLPLSEIFESIVRSSNTIQDLNAYICVLIDGDSVNVSLQKKKLSEIASLLSN